MQCSLRTQRPRLTISPISLVLAAVVSAVSAFGLQASPAGATSGPTATASVQVSAPRQVQTATVPHTDIVLKDKKRILQSALDKDDLVGQHREEVHRRQTGRHDLEPHEEDTDRHLRRPVPGEAPTWLRVRHVPMGNGSRTLRFRGRQVVRGADRRSALR